MNNASELTVGYEPCAVTPSGTATTVNCAACVETTTVKIPPYYGPVALMTTLWPVALISRFVICPGASTANLKAFNQALVPAIR